MGKVFIVDTSVIMHDPQAPIILADKDNLAVIPLPVLEELEHFKVEGNGKGFNAREAFRILDELRKKGALSTGVKTELGGEVVVSTTEIKRFPDGMARTNDNRIILTAQKMKHKNPQVKIVSKDRALRIKAEALGIESEDYENDKVVRKVEELYSGFTKINLTSTTDFVISQIYKAPVSVNEIRGLDLSALHPNQCCEFVSAEGKTALAIFKKEGGKFFRVHKPKDYPDKKVGPINNEQAFASALINDEELSIITLFGKAGTGKTLMALSVACDLVGEKYDQILVYRPNIEVGQQMGFLPGDIEEKFQPFMYPILDNLARILGKPTKMGKKTGTADQKRGNFDLASEYLENELIVIEPINFIRGRSLHSKIVIVDECQNLTPHEVKTLITRAGMDTKVILTGDPTQIDNPYVDFASNGLSHVIVRFIGQQCFGNILLIKGERSPLSELASNIL
ncbi:PhoH family protein [Candidatus Falkowbacteria bacterium]|nr:PhoH family protein [Candidatus Falkowbacteria bacterium]